MIDYHRLATDQRDKIAELKKTNHELQAQLDIHQAAFINVQGQLKAKELRRDLVDAAMEEIAPWLSASLEENGYCEEYERAVHNLLGVMLL